MHTPPERRPIKVEIQVKDVPVKMILRKILDSLGDETALLAIGNDQKLAKMF